MAADHSSSTRLDRAAIAAVAERCLADACSADARDILSRLYAADLDVGEIVTMIERQPTLALRVLKVANGVLYRHLGDVCTIERAVLVLGMEAVRGVVAAVCLNRRMYSGSSTKNEADALYAHCVATALASRDLACRSRPELAEHAFLAGLVHDIGAALLERAHGDGWRMLLRMIGESPAMTPAEVHELEARILGVDHSLCATIAFETWRLPHWLGEVVGAHHCSMNAAESCRDLAVILHLADEICIRAGLGLPYERTSPECDPRALQSLGLGDHDLEQVAAMVVGARVDLTDALNA